MLAERRHRAPARIGHLRIEEVEARAFLPQILHLRATRLSRRISLSPDPYAWSDPADITASHWGIFSDAGLVAAARLSLCSEEMIESLRARGAPCSGPAAAMSHCVVDPRFEDCHLDGMLDAARMERARQLRCATLVAMPENLQRVRTLAALGFTALGRADLPYFSGGVAFVLDLSREDTRAHVIAKRPPRG